MNGLVTVREVMNREYVGASESDDLLETTELLVREAEETVLVLRGNEPVGVVTRDDILARLVTDADVAAVTVGDVMTESIPAIEPDAWLPEARDKMTTLSVDWLLVVEDGDPLGTLTGQDILTTARFEDETTEVTERPPEMVTTSQGATAEGTTTAAEDSFEEQGICSACGTLTQDLASFNGQLLCADCRDV